jgi:hypothetical protein
MAEPGNQSAPASDNRIAMDYQPFTPEVMAARLQRTREGVRSMLGEDYERSILPYRIAVQAAAVRFGCSIVHAPFLQAAEAKKAGDPLDGLVLARLFAAAVEEFENQPANAQGGAGVVER